MSSFLHSSPYWYADSVAIAPIKLTPGNILEPVLQIDGYPNQATYQKCRQWADTILTKLK